MTMEGEEKQGDKKQEREYYYKEQRRSSMYVGRSSPWSLPRVESEWVVDTLELTCELTLRNLHNEAVRVDRWE